MKIKILLLIFIFLNLFTSKSVAQCNTTRAQDSLTLMQFYNATNGASWNNTMGKWGINAMNTWFGVTLNASGRVIRLELPNNNLTGTLPVEFAKLCVLQTLELSDNKIGGTLPPQMSSMFGLTVVRMNGNQLSGQIPRFIATSLSNLDLGNNQLSGTLPALDSCFSLKSLELRNNKISGTIPALIFTTHTYTLDYFSVSNNQFTGSIPTQIGGNGISSLRTLYLDMNQLTGGIPKELGLCRQLLTIDLSNNQLLGAIPPEINNIWTSGTSLRQLILNNNKLSGSIPSFRSLNQIQMLDFSINAFSVIPSSLDSLPNLTHLNLSYNQITGNIPVNLMRDTSLVFLGISDNKLTGAIPSTIGNLKKLVYVSFANNGLNVALPPSLSGATKLRELYLFGNQIPSTIPPQYGLLDSLEIFQIERNQLAGTVPFELSKIKRLAHFSVAYNKLDSLSNFSSGMNGQVLVTPYYKKGFYCNNNKFTFDDILPNLPLRAKPSFDFAYLGQDSIICTSKSSTLPRGENFTIALNIDGGLTSNVYRWFKDGKLIDKTNVNKLTLNKVQPCHAGTYSCQVTNPAVPSMVLVCPNQVIAVPEPFQSCAPYEITTFPNPVENILNVTIVSPPDDVRLMRLSNMLGQVVWSRRFDEGDVINGLSLDCGNFPNGSYFLSLYTEGGLLSLTKRVQVLKK
jgi:Leucine-rich repeat (LRR) protein